jgi:hypothetical protein
MTFEGPGLLIDERLTDWCASHIAATELTRCDGGKTCKRQMTYLARNPLIHFAVAMIPPNVLKCSYPYSKRLPQHVLRDRGVPAWVARHADPTHLVLFQDSPADDAARVPVRAERLRGIAAHDQDAPASVRSPQPCQVIPEHPFRLQPASRDDRHRHEPGLPDRPRRAHPHRHVLAVQEPHVEPGTRRDDGASALKSADFLPPHAQGSFPE